MDHQLNINKNALLFATEKLLSAFNILFWDSEVTELEKKEKFGPCAYRI
jgi:hypothetical protein